MVPFSGKFVQFSGGLNHPCQLHRHNSRNLRGSDGRRDFHLRRKQAGNGAPLEQEIPMLEIHQSFGSFVLFMLVFGGWNLGSEMVSNGNLLFSGSMFFWSPVLACLFGTNKSPAF